MAPRDPSRPKAAHISTLDMLASLRRHQDFFLPHPIEAFSDFPRKVVLAKLRKMRLMGFLGHLASDRKVWTEEGYSRVALLTKPGRAKLAELEADLGVPISEIMPTWPPPRDPT